MDETITKRKDGRYELKLTLGVDEFGKRIRKSFYGQTKKETKAKKDEWFANGNALKVNPIEQLGNDTGFSQWADIWLKEYKKDNVREYTYKFTYEARVEKYLKPHFKNRPLQSITPIDIQMFFNKNKNLSIDLLKTLRVILNGIFSTAIDNEICHRNPTANVALKSSYIKTEKNVLNEEQVKIATKWCIQNKQYDILTVLKTGVRRGELLGIRWKDVDFKNRTISINESISPDTEDFYVKTQSSIRTIPIDEELCTALNQMQRLSERVFNCTNANAYGRRVARQLKKMSEECNMPTVTLHGLRHTYGTVLRERGVDIYTISKLLGHSGIGITAKIYVHNDVEVMRRAIFGD